MNNSWTFKQKACFMVFKGPSCDRNFENCFRILLRNHFFNLKGDCRTYSYVAAISSDDEHPCWESLTKLAKIIPKLCKVNRWFFCFTMNLCLMQLLEITKVHQVQLQLSSNKNTRRFLKQYLQCISLEKNNFMARCLPRSDMLQFQL